MSPIEDLYIDKDDIIEKLVESSKGLIGIERETGKTIIIAPLNKISTSQKIMLYMLGKFFAAENNLVDSDQVNVTEISEALGIDSKVASARISDLKNEGYTISPKRGSHELVIAKVDIMLEEIKKNLEK